MSSASPRGYSAEDFGDSLESSQSANQPRVGIDMLPGSVHVLSDSTCDFNTKLENSRLRGQVKQLQLDLKSEQDTIASLRRKLAECGKEKLDVISRCTAETAALMTANSSLRVELEKREESLQQLQFEVNQLQRQLSQEVQAKARREEQRMADVDALEERLMEASRRYDVAQQQAAEQRARLADDVELLSKELEDRDRAVAGCRLERASLEAERRRLTELVQQQAETISSLQESTRLLEGEVARQKDASRRLLADLELLQGRERDVNKELEASKLKIKSLEECIEAERSAHLESRFSTEIVQLKFRDLEAALEAEKQAKLEAMSKIERLHSHLRDVEEAYTDERKQCKAALEKLDKTEKDFANAQRKLQSELADKKSLVAGLTEQLEVHQLDVDALKAELQRARKKQGIMEDTYEGNTKDLEMLMADFNIGLDNRQTRDSKTGRIPAAMLDTLRQALSTYKKDHEFNAEELQKLRHLCDCLIKEADTYKEALNASQAALQDAQRAANHADSELAKVKVQLSDADARLMAVKDQLRAAEQELSKERSAASGQQRELSTAVAQLKQEEDKYARLLQGLHQRLSFVVGHPGGGGSGAATWHNASSGGGDAGGGGHRLPLSSAVASPLPSLDVSSLVLEQVVTATAELQRLREKLKSSEEAERGRERALADVKRECDDQLVRLRAAFEAQEGKLRQQLEEAEQRCARLGDEMRQNSKATHKMAAEAWGKVKQTGQLQQELENECTDLRAKVLLFNGHQRALHTAFALLAGAYYALATRARALAAQRDLAEGQLRHVHSFKRRACQLWCTLMAAADGNAAELPPAATSSSPEGGRPVSLAATTGDAKPTTQSSSHGAQPLPPLLRFRVATIAVLAAHRLRRLHKLGCRAFAFTDPTGRQHTVRLGVTGIDRAAKDSAHGRRAIVKSLISEADVLEWLTSKDLLAAVIACTEDVQEVLGKMMETEAFVRPGLLVTTLSNSFTKLVGRLEPLYCSAPNAERLASPRPCKDSPGLAHVLGRGLRAALERAQRSIAAGGCIRQRHSELLPVETVVAGLQQQTLALVRRLHASELDRKRVRRELATVQAQLADCERRAAEGEGMRAAMQAELDGLSAQQETMVLTSTYEGVCRELREALGRERSAQQLLSQQGEQLQELTARVEGVAAELDTAQRALQEAEQTAVCHQTVRQREEESLRQLTAQLTRVDLERKSLRDDVYEAERALRSAVRNRDIVVNYLKTLHAALQQYSTEGSWHDLPQLLLSSDLLPSDGDSEQQPVELAACRSAAVSFASVLQRAGLQVAAQQAELVAHRAHVTRLKEELTAACQRRELGPAPLAGKEAGNSGGSAAATVGKARAEHGRQPASHAPRAGVYHAKAPPLVSPVGKDEDEYGPLPLQEDSDASFVTTAQDDMAPGHRSPHPAYSRRTAGGSSTLISVRGSCRTPTICQK